MRQTSLFSAEASSASVNDLAGLLCAQGQVQGFGRGTAARVSIVVAERWRAVEIARACEERGLPAEQARTEEDHYGVRTALVVGLLPLVGAWTRGAVKAVPGEWQPSGAALRLWVLAAGIPDERGYLLRLDPRAPDTHAPLEAALARVGLAATFLDSRSAGPRLRVSSRRRMARLAELVGEAPLSAPAGQWPT
ncbi:MAG TPA: hypothetical protein VFO16_19065 [Pseudonocardiaceae bacterium]|nr:hypothetical protein [Pseudonocardiaceae bacterium]